MSMSPLQKACIAYAEHKTIAIDDMLAALNTPHFVQLNQMKLLLQANAPQWQLHVTQFSPTFNIDVQCHTVDEINMVATVFNEHAACLQTSVVEWCTSELHRYNDRDLFSDIRETIKRKLVHATAVCRLLLDISCHLSDAYAVFFAALEE